MNTMPASSVGNSRMATGTMAIAGMGRASSTSGPNTSANNRERPSSTPVATPTTAASPNPVRIRISDCARSSQYSPVPSRRCSALTISVTVGSVSNRSNSRTLSAVSNCHTPIAAATDASRSSRDCHRAAIRRGRATAGVETTPRT